MAASYVGCAIATAALVIIFQGTFIFFSVRSRAKTEPEFRGRSVEFLLDYIAYGFAYYKEALKEADRNLAANLDPLSALGELGSVVSTVIVHSAVARDGFNKELLYTGIDQSLTAIESTIQVMRGKTHDLKLKSNYMVLVPADKLGTSQSLFLENGTVYEKLLAFRRYKDGVRLEIALPIERDARSLHVLPGAPSCVTERAATHINIKKLEFREGVSDGIKEQVAEYFRNASYSSVLSIPLIWGQELIGVVNIESSEIDIVGRGPDCIEAIGKALSPHCLILGELVHHHEELSNVV